MQQIRREMATHLQVEKVKSETYGDYLERSRESYEEAIATIKKEIAQCRTQQQAVRDKITHYKKTKEARAHFIKRLQNEPAKVELRTSIEEALKGTLSDASFAAHVGSLAVLADEIQDPSQNTLLAVAARNQDAPLTRFLMGAGASLHSRNIHHETPLMLIAQQIGFQQGNGLYFEALNYAHNEARPYLEGIENQFKTLVLFSKGLTPRVAGTLKDYTSIQRERQNSLWDRWMSEIKKLFSGDLTLERRVSVAKAYDILVNNEKSHNYALMLAGFAQLLKGMEEMGYTDDSRLFATIAHIVRLGNNTMVTHRESYQQQFLAYCQKQEARVKELESKLSQQDAKIEELKDDKIKQLEINSQQKAEIEELKDDKLKQLKINSQLETKLSQQDTKIAELDALVRRLLPSSIEKKGEAKAEAPIINEEQKAPSQTSSSFFG